MEKKHAILCKDCIYKKTCPRTLVFSVGEGEGKDCVIPIDGCEDGVKKENPGAPD